VGVVRIRGRVLPGGDVVDLFADGDRWTDDPVRGAGLTAEGWLLPGVCSPTFRAGYLSAGATPHCIDFILTAGEVTADSAALVFTEKEPLGSVSDHIGLRARLSLTPTG
jgi:hypothetical protein